jgi:hypothetical protein
MSSNSYLNTNFALAGKPQLLEKQGVNVAS